MKQMGVRVWTRHEERKQGRLFYILNWETISGAKQLKETYDL